jgi:Flp pilus assembly protein TadG
MRRGHPHGQALVEFALVLPLFILLLLGIFDFGRAVYAWSTINNAAREGARIAIVDQTASHIEDEAVRQSVALGLSAADVAIEYRNSDDSAACSSLTAPPIGCLAIVTVDYQYQAATPLIGQLVGTIDLEGRTVLPIEATCVEPTQPKCPKGT